MSKVAKTFVRRSQEEVKTNLLSQRFSQTDTAVEAQEERESENID